MNTETVKEDTQLAATPAAKINKAPVTFGAQGVQLASLEDAYRFANAIVASGFAPKGMEKPESVLVAIQLGAERAQSRALVFSEVHLDRAWVGHELAGLRDVLRSTSRSRRGSCGRSRWLVGEQRANGAKLGDDLFCVLIGHCVLALGLRSPRMWRISHSRKDAVTCLWISRHVTQPSPGMNTQ